MTKHPNLVAWRKAHGSLCHVCPLNGQRHAGSDGPIHAEHIGVGDFPSRDDVDDGSTRGQAHGRAFSDGIGYFMKLENLVPAGLATLIPLPGRKWPRVELSNTFLMNVIMCNIPGKGKPQKKIKSPVGRAAVACCANSYRAVMRRMYKDNPNRTLTTMGTTATSVTLGTPAAIEAFRGRVPAVWGSETISRLFALEPEIQIYKRVLRGKHPTEVWWPRFEKTINAVLRLQRSGVRAAAKRLPEDVSVVIRFVGIMLTKQRSALRKRAKQEREQNNGTSC